jgi:hypothetical protein
MPAKSAKQRRFMGAELARKRSGKRTRTGMSEAYAPRSIICAATNGDGTRILGGSPERDSTG